MDNNTPKPPSDKPITVRIPLDLLQAIEDKASDRYPSRKGDGGNRSQVILDALVFYQSHQWGEDGIDAEKKLLSDNVHDVVENIVSQRIQSLTDSLEYLIEKALDKRLQGVQSIISENSLQSTQDNTSETGESLQSVQSVTENNPSEDEQEAPITITEGDEAVLETKTEGETEKPTTQGFDGEGLTGLELGQKIGLSPSQISKWKIRRDKGMTSVPSKKYAIQWGKFMQWEFKGDRWFPIE
jgi:hypothetical protein